MQIPVFTTLLCLVGSSFAYSVTYPNEQQGWSTSGPQTLSWSRVDTDAQFFAVVLSNEDRTVLLRDSLVAGFVDGNHLTTQIYPGPTGFPTGSHFRVNLVQTANDLNTIYAQSNEFTICD